MKLIIPLLVFEALSACVDYPSSDPPLYCDSVVTWPVSDTIANNVFEQNRYAMELYRNLKQRYLDLSTKDPTLDCLAVAYQFYCSHAFPYCTDTEPTRGVCHFLCAIWKDRCPKEPHAFFCSNNETSHCSNAVSLMSSLLLIYLSFI
ncbi:unnamed protein product [Blepharisma stoltei]|uniref:FZ domain-containing protein n=1 Tax=Blepharisma stoltei TaxID=1481888 RepID=A0AAU9K678_9CILI|nr:unnamed protein product [Blepharisma stoltei]